MNNETTRPVSDVRTLKTGTKHTNPSTYADPSELFSRAKGDPKFVIRSLYAGPERVVLVLSQALHGNIFQERHENNGARVVSSGGRT